MRFFGLKSCDTCRKALAAIHGAGLEPQVVDVRADRVADGDLATFLSAFGDELVNRRSTTWRGLDEAARSQAPLALLQANPTLMKRPVIEWDDGALTLGWSGEVAARLG